MSTGPIYAALIRHAVADFDVWKRAFDAHEGARREAGVTMHNLHRNADDANELVVYLASGTLEALQGFMAAPELKQAMADAGVTGAPEITFVQNRDMAISADGAATVGVVISHPVADYDRWKGAFDAHGAARKAGGVIGHSINTVVGDDNQVVALAQGSDLDALRAFFASPDLKEAMAGAGVTGPPSLLFVEHVEMKRY